MAEEDAQENEVAVGDEDIVDGLEKKKISGKMIVIGAAALVVVLIIGVVVMSLMGGDEEETVDQVEAQIEQMAQDTAKANEAKQLEADKTPEELKLLFIELEEQLYNLNTDGQGSSFLRLKVALEIDRESFKVEIEEKMPRVIDELNVYMREMRPSDLDGGVGIMRLKEELLMRINQSVAPARVKDVLFQDFVIQGS